LKKISSIFFVAGILALGATSRASEPVMKLSLCRNAVQGILKLTGADEKRISKVAILTDAIVNSKVRKYFGPLAVGNEFVRQVLSRNYHKMLSRFYSESGKDQLSNERQYLVELDVEDHEYLLKYSVSLFNGYEVVRAEDLQIKASESLSFNQIKIKAESFKKIESVDYVLPSRYVPFNLKNETWVFGQDLKKTFSLMNAGNLLEHYLEALIYRGPTICWTNLKGVRDCVVFVRRKHRSFALIGEKDISDLFVLGSEKSEGQFEAKRIVQRNRGGEFRHYLNLYFSEYANQIGLPKSGFHLEARFKDKNYKLFVDSMKFAKIHSLHKISLAELNQSLKNVFLVKVADDLSYKPNQTVLEEIYEMYMVGPQNRVWSAIVRKSKDSKGRETYELLSAYRNEKSTLGDDLSVISPVEYLKDLSQSL
jgi:hypothetical protein